MIIQSVQMENWKSIKKAKEMFKIQNIINKPNGTGKSSVFQAIIFGLFGKMPPGFNLNSLRQDPSKPCKILVSFEHDGDNYESYRQFGGTSYVAIKKNGQTVCTSSKEAFAYMDKMLPYNIMSVLWAPQTLSSSNILKPNFLVDHLLDYIFEEPKFLLGHYKYELFAQNKIVNNLKSKLMDVDDTEKLLKEKEVQILELKEKLKERSSFSDAQASKASVAKAASEELSKEQWNDILEPQLMNSFRSLVGRNKVEDVQRELEERIKKEEEKDDSSPLLQIQPGALRAIKGHSEKSGCCLMCDKEWEEKDSLKIQKVLDNPDAKNPDLIKNLKEKLEVSRTSQKLVDKSLRYQRLNEQISSSRDWKEVLEKYDKENNTMWSKLEKLQREKEQLQKQEDLKKSYILEVEKAKHLSTRTNIISAYIREASAYYSRALTEEASNILGSLNSRYDQIFVDEGEYKVSVISSDMSTMNLLPAMQLSSGEKTLIGISLILASHKLFFPYAPLLFDESFSALDRENVQELKKLFALTKYQTFIITHDEIWTQE